MYLYGSNDSYEDIAWNYIVTSEEYLLEQKDLVHSSWNKLHIDFSYKIEDFIKSENINYYKEFIEKYDNIADFDVSLKNI